MTIAVSQPVIMAGSATSVTFTAIDANGRRETSGGLAVAFLPGSRQRLAAHFSTITDNGDGTYTAAFTGTTVGADTITATIDNDLAVTSTTTLTVAPARGLALVRAGRRPQPDGKHVRRDAGDHHLGAVAQHQPAEDRSRLGPCLRQRSTISATGLTYQNAGSPTTSQCATIDISLTNNVSSLAATLPGDGLTLGPIRDLQGGMGSIAASAATIDVRGSTPTTPTATWT